MTILDEIEKFFASEVEPYLYRPLTYCCSCHFFLECRGSDLLDGDDYNILGKLYHPICGQFRLVQPKEFEHEQSDPAST